jgi:hypothetical protein
MLYRRAAVNRVLPLGWATPREVGWMFLWRSLRPDAVSILLRYLAGRAGPAHRPVPLAGRLPNEHLAADSSRPSTPANRPSPAPSGR